MPPQDEFGLQAIAQTLQRMTERMPQNQLIQERLRQMQQEQFQGQLLRNFFATVDPSKMSPSDILARVASITGDVNVVGAYTNALFKDKALAVEQQQRKDVAAIFGLSGQVPQLDETREVAGALAGAGVAPGEAVRSASALVPPAKPKKFNTSLYNALSGDVTTKQRTPQEASDLFYDQTGIRIEFRPEVKNALDKMGGAFGPTFLSFFTKRQTIVGEAERTQGKFLQISAAADRLLEMDYFDRGPDEEAIITSFKKILDEPSVVRESEYDRTSEGQALIRRFRGKIDAITEGGAGITNDTIIEIRELAGIIVARATEHANRRLDPLRKGARAGGLDPDIFAPPIGLVPELERFLEGGTGAITPATEESSANVNAPPSGIELSDEQIDAYLNRKLGGQ